MSYRTGMGRGQEKRGFIALVAVVVLGLMLLGLSVEQSLAGWYARYNVLSAENKEQANALAEGCADVALAQLVADPSFDYDAPIVTVTEQGTCTVEIDTSIQGLASIKSQGEVEGSYANLEMTINLSDVHIGDTVITPSNGTLVVSMNVKNDDGGGAELDDFDVTVSGGTPNSFDGVESQAVSVTGFYAVSIDNATDYTAQFSGDCDDNGEGNIAVGEVKSCVVTLDDVPTTITVIANVINDEGGTRTPADFILEIDGTPVAQGEAISVAPGAHTVSGPGEDDEYTVSSWGYECTAAGSVTVGLSEQKTCVINYDDKPQPLACADTLMMLDRTGSMTSGDLANERAAAKALLDLFKTLTQPPKVGVGRFGISSSNSNAEVQTRGQLTSVFGDDDSGDDSDNDLYDAVEEATLLGSAIYTNLGSAISVGDAELNSSRHRITDPKTKKVLILISDGEPNRPGCSGVSTCSTSLNAATAAADDAKTAHGPDNAPTSLYTIHFGSAGTNNTNKIFLASLSSGGSYDPSSTNTNFRGPSASQGGAWINPTGAHDSGGSAAQNNTGATRDYFQFGFGGAGGVPSGSTIKGITVNADARSTDASGCSLGVRVSWNNGASWSSQSTLSLSNATSTRTFGGSTNTWGHSWTANEVQNSLRVQIQDVDPGGNCDNIATSYVDYLRVQVAYTDEQSENNDGDYFYVAPQASDMEDIFTEIGEKECPALDPDATVAPDKGTVTVITKVINDDEGTKNAADFTMTLEGDDFDGAPAPGVSRQIYPGSYSVGAETDSGYTISKDVNCSSTVLGALAAGESRTCTVTYDDKTPPPPPPDLNIIIGSWQERPNP